MIDYLHYRKAPLLVQNLDYLLRTRSGGGKSFADFISRLYSEYGQHRAPAPLLEAISRYAGFDVTPFFERHVVGDDILMPLWDEVFTRYRSRPREVAAWVDGEPVLADRGFRRRISRGQAAGSEIARLIDEKLLERELLNSDPQAIPPELLRVRAWLPEAWQGMLARKVRERLCHALYGDDGEASERRLDARLVGLRRRAALRPGRADLQLPAASDWATADWVGVRSTISSPSTKQALTSEEAGCALRLARAALSLYVGERRVLDARALPPAAHCPLVGPLLDRRAVFVTLRRAGRLRGCVGSFPPASQALWQGIVEAAGRAACHDERYPAVAREELGELELEVSVLQEPRSLAPGAPIRLGSDALMIAHDGRRALLLPWAPTESGWDRETTLAQLSRKAGLPSDSWRRGARLFALETQDLREPPRLAPQP